jgi:hypothetical protein
LGLVRLPNALSTDDVFVRPDDVAFVCEADGNQFGPFAKERMVWPSPEVAGFTQLAFHGRELMLIVAYSVTETLRRLAAGVAK